MKGRYTATKKGVKKGYRILKDKATALKKSVTCKAKKVIKTGKTLLNNTKKLVRSGMTKVSNAYNKLKSGAKSALGYMGKSIKNFFVPESAYASSSSSSSTKKSAPKQTDLYQQMLLTSQYYQYVQSGGTKSFYEFKNSGSIMNDIHFMLDMIGVVFDGADPANGALYLSEGDYKNAGISFVAAVPVVGSLGTVGRTSKNLKKITNAEKAAETEIKLVPDYVKENRVPRDKETVLNTSQYIKTGKTYKGAAIYKKGDKYYYRDTFHKGEAAHLEVFDKRGKHLGEADIGTGKIKEGTADPKKTISLK